MKLTRHPHDTAAEQAVLGAVLLDPDATNLIDDLALTPDDFYHTAHATIWQAIIDMWNRAEPIDPVTVTDRLRRTGNLDRAGGVSLITRLIDIVPVPGHAPYYARIVREHALRRHVAANARKLTRLATTYTTTPDALTAALKATNENTTALTKHLETWN